MTRPNRLSGTADQLVPWRASHASINTCCCTAVAPDTSISSPAILRITVRSDLCASQLWTARTTLARPPVASPTLTTSAPKATRSTARAPGGGQPLMRADHIIHVELQELFAEIH